MSEAIILRRLFRDWLSLTMEYAEGAPDIRAVYVLASSERIGTNGTMFANAYFDQRGTVLAPDDVEGASVTSNRVGEMQRILLDHLEAAESDFARSGLQPPTEYRVFYEPSTGRTDVQLARENKYIGNDELSPRHGIRYWLGDRAPKNI